MSLGTMLDARHRRHERLEHLKQLLRALEFVAPPLAGLGLVFWSVARLAVLRNADGPRTSETTDYERHSNPSRWRQMLLQAAAGWCPAAVVFGNAGWARPDSSRENVEIGLAGAEAGGP
jgi:hypothetical protein